MRIAKGLICVATINACVGAVLADENWPRFRGADATGVAADNPGLPSEWDTEKNVTWSTEIPGWGWAQPIVWDGRVYVSSVLSDGDYEFPKKGLYLGRGRSEPPETLHHWLVYCLDLNSGDILWKREPITAKPNVPRHPKATYASETPTTDGKRLYVLFGDVGLFCYSFEGDLIWKQEIESKKTMYGYGAAASPIVHDDQVIMVYDNHESSYIAAYDTETGSENWRIDRDEKSTWATPFVWQNSIRTEIIVPGKKKNRSYDLKGNVNWTIAGPMSNLVIPSPFADSGLLYITSGYIGDKERPVYAIKPGMSGDIDFEDEDVDKQEFLEWYLPQAGPYNPTPILYRGLYYTLHDRGFVTCHDAKTGEEVYGKKRFAPGASFTASPWAYNGKLFFLSEDGETYVVKAGPEFELEGTNPLDEIAMASPAISGDKLLIRTGSKIYCLTK